MEIRALRDRIVAGYLRFEHAGSQNLSCRNSVDGRIMTKKSDTRGYACARDDLAEMPVDDGLVILDKSNDKVHQLNSIARAVWDWTRQGAGPVDIADRIVSTYDVAPETAMKDVQGVLEELLTLNLLELVHTEQPISEM